MSQTPIIVERILGLVRQLTTPDVEQLAQHVTHLRYRLRHR